MDIEAPDADVAAAIAKLATGCAPLALARFPTGARHYVYEASFADRPPVVVRVGDRNAHAEMAGAVHLSGFLRPLGVRLPTILAQDVHAEFPWVVLERLPGVDLGDLIGTFSDAQLERIAARVAHAQSIAAQTRSAGRYGIAVRPEDAPHARWSQAVAAHLARSRRRIAAADLFDPALADLVQARLAALRAQLDAIPPTPYLHDTTTKNVIVTPEGEMSGIVDVDDLGFGDPRYPAALTLAVLSATDGPVHYVAAWLRYARAADDRLFRLYVAVFLLDLMSEHGQTFNGNQAPSSPAARRTLQRAFDDNLANCAP